MDETRNSTYTPVFDTLTQAAGNTQYFSTFFSWVVVCFTYFTIGVRGGSIWRYLLLVTTVDFFSSFLSTCYNLSISLNFEYNIFFKILTWMEGICWALSEWGYVYINFIKIKTCIKIFNKKYWHFIMYFLLINCIAFHCLINYFDYLFKSEYGNYEIINNSDSRNILLSLLFCPLGLVCVIFFFCNIKELINSDDKDARNNNRALLHSNLTRMLLVTTVFLGYFLFTVLIYIYKKKNTEVVDTFIFFRELLWKVKGSFGIIFLVDLLLLRIDIDRGNMCNKEKEMQKMASIHSNYDMPLHEEEEYTNHSTRSGISYQYKRKKSTIEYASELLSSRNNNSFIPKTSPTAEGSDISLINQHNADVASTISINKYPGKSQIHINGIENKFNNSISRSLSKKKSAHYNLYTKNPLYNHSYISPISPASTSNEQSTYMPNVNMNPNEIIPSSSVKTDDSLTVDISKKPPINNALWEYMFDD